MSNQLVKDKVKFLKYGKEKLPILISFRALKLLKDHYKLDLGEVEDLSNMEVILKVGLESGYRAMDQIAKYPNEDTSIEDILDVSFMEFMSLMATFFVVPEQVQDVKKK